MTDSELATASRATLLAFIAELQATVAQSESTVAELLKRISALEHRLASGGGAGMPGNKPEATRPKPPPKSGRNGRTAMAVRV